MTQIGIQSEFAAENSVRQKIWLLFLLFALLFHALLFTLRLDWSTPSPSPRIEVQTVDPKKLDAIRKQWREKNLLVDRDRSKPSEKEAPPDARYMSDRNIRVEKEQRAKDTNAVPKPKQPKQSEKTDKPKPQEKTPQAQPKTHKPSKPLLKLGQLGVPIPLDSKAQEKPQPPKQQSREPQSPATAGPEGGAQAIPDKELPVGSENILNAQESVYYSFFARLYDAIGPLWQSRIRGVPYHRRVNSGEYSTVVDVVLDQSGNLVEVRRIQSSGIEEFDLAVDESWKKIGNFPNPPRGLLDQEGKVHTGWTFTVQVGEGFNLNSLPPERNY
jgi:outer membrane biosynthesis protein TonB